MNKGMIAFILLLIFNYIILVFVIDVGDNDSSSDYIEQIERLNEENDMLKNENVQLDKEVVTLTEQKDSLTTALELKAIKREELKIKRDEKMDSIDGMDNNKLYGFFASFKTDSLKGQSRH